MHRSLAPPPGRLAALAVALVIAMGACHRDVPTKVDVVHRIGLSIPSLVLRPGQTMQIVASPLDARDLPVNAAVTWQSLTPTLLTVDANGLVRALAPGTALARAAAGSATADVSITLVNPPAASIEVGADTMLVPIPGVGVALQPIVRDADSLLIYGATLAWQSRATRIATVSPAGQITPRAVGDAMVVVTVDDRIDSVFVRVQPELSPTAPVVSAVLSSPIQPGVPIVIQGERFSPIAASNVVLVDGVPLGVTAATSTALTAVLPPTGLPCLPSGTVALQVATAGGVGARDVELQIPPRLTLAPGEATVYPSAASSSCQELVLADGEYLFTVVHAATALGSGPIGLSLSGRVAPGATVGAVVAEDPAVLIERDDHSPRTRSARSLRRLHAHDAVLRASRDFVVRTDRRDRPRAVRDGDAELQLPPVGGIVAVRVPDLDAPNICTAFQPIGARTVYSGAHIVILEDTASVVGGTPTLAGAMDGIISALGDEVEAAMWPVLTQFGDPLVMDSRLDANGKIAVVLTPRMNAMRDGALLGAVVSCDFFPRAAAPSSNVGEVLYLQVPTSFDGGLGVGTRERWRWEIRSVVAHELRHVVSFAERIVRNIPSEELWLEEALARVAEELYARTLYSAPQGGDATYDHTVRCEGREQGLPAGCADVPRVMRAHLEGLYEFLDTPAARSPLGGSSAADLSYYGSAWSLTRWALDQSAQPESTILASLTTSTQSGVSNLESRLGLPWAAMLSLWSLALLVDGETGVSVLSPQLEFPSWNLTDLFAGLCADAGGCGGGATTGLFGRAHPAQPQPISTGNFDIALPQVQPGGFVALRLTGSVSTGRQLIELRGPTGPLASTARLAILRVR